MGFGLRYTELLPPGVDLEFDRFYKFFKQLWLKEHNEDGTHITDNPTSGVAPASAAYVTVGNTTSLSAERALVGTSNQVTVSDGGANGNVTLGLPQSINVGATPTFTNVKHSALTSGRVAFVTTDGALSDDADLTFSADTLTSTKVVGGDVSIGAAAAAATACRQLTKKITGIADAVATDILTVTVPNANHATAIRLLLLSSNGSTDAFESSRVATGHVVVARTTGVNAVAAVAAIDDAAIVTVAGGATHTLAYDLSAISGAVGATNTFTVRVTIDDSGNLGSNQVVVFAELLNAEATGITIL